MLTGDGANLKEGGVGGGEEGGEERVDEAGEGGALAFAFPLEEEGV